MRNIVTLVVLMLSCVAAPASSQQVVRVEGQKSPDASAPTANRNLPVLPAIACAAAQSYTTGRVVFPCTNLFGYTGVFLTDPTTGAALTGATDVTEDAAETAGGTGPFVLSVRRDTRASSAGTTGDNASFNTDATGNLYTNDSNLAIGASGLKRTSAGATEDEHEIKASAGVLYSITTTNTNAAVRYLRCANQVAASTTPGTTTPVIDLAIPGATTGAGFTTSFPQGFAFSTGLTCWLVTGAADTDVAEVAADEIKVFYTFK